MLLNQEHFRIIWALRMIYSLFKNASFLKQAQEILSEIKYKTS